MIMQYIILSSIHFTKAAKTRTRFSSNSLKYRTVIGENQVPVTNTISKNIELLALDCELKGGPDLRSNGTNPRGSLKFWKCSVI